MRMCLAFFLLLVSSTAFGHARWKLNGPTPPRSNDTGLKSPPCGDKPRGTTPKTFTAGSTITLEWEETINHLGRFEIEFSEAGDANFQMLAQMNDDQNNAAVPHNYSMSVKLPDKVCTECTLRLVQVMLDNPAAPSNYYSCSDIELKAASPSPGPGPTPSPSPSPGNCNP